MTGSACSRPQLSVVVPTRDRPDRLASCLAALMVQTADSYEIVVVDDASVDASAVARAVADAPHARLVLGEGRGPAAARNLGAGVARGEVVCFTDDDCRPTPGWLDALAAAITAGADASAGPTRNGGPGSALARAAQLVANHLSEASLDTATGRLGFAPTSNLACRMEVHRHVPFDESYPLAAGEDREWCRRLAEHGYELVAAPSALVVHHQELTPAGFWRQQVRYGRGAYRFHRNATSGTHLQPPRFYVDLLRRALAQGPTTAALVGVAQVATAVGMASEALADRHH